MIQRLKAECVTSSYNGGKRKRGDMIMIYKYLTKIKDIHWNHSMQHIWAVDNDAE